MKNTNQCSQGLLYSSFAIIQLQTFCTDSLRVTTDGNFVKDFKDPVDCQLFTNQQQFYKRYELKGFDVSIDIDDKNTLKGHVYVRAIKFFDSCMQLSYRFVVANDNTDKNKLFCRIHHSFNTDQLIVAAGLAQKVEHWNVNEQTGEQLIDGIVKKVAISKIPLDADSVLIETPSKDEEELSLEEVMRRYRYYFDKSKYTPDSLHTFIDVCSDIGHDGDVNFKDYKEAGIIEHIENRHKAELVGLMSLYPKEWPYRMDASYNDICGRNIAIDTDDLVLTNQNLSVVFGTYGMRGYDEENGNNEEKSSEKEGINWKKHLKKRDLYHVCWPEYLILIELLLAKKHTINYAIARYIRESNNATNKDIRKLIAKNARLSIQLSNTIMELDSIRYLRYVAHKHMFKLAEQNLGILEDEQYLNETISRMDSSLNNVSNNIELNQAEKLNDMLLIVSIIAALGAILQIVLPAITSEKNTLLMLCVNIGGLTFSILLLIPIYKYLKRKINGSTKLQRRR